MTLLQEQFLFILNWAHALFCSTLPWTPANLYHISITPNGNSIHLSSSNLNAACFSRLDMTALPPTIQNAAPAFLLGCLTSNRCSLFQPGFFFFFLLSSFLFENWVWKTSKGADLEGLLRNDGISAGGAQTWDQSAWMSPDSTAQTWENYFTSLSFLIRQMRTGWVSALHGC